MPERSEDEPLVLGSASCGPRTFLVGAEHAQVVDEVEFIKILRGLWNIRWASSRCFIGESLHVSGPRLVKEFEFHRIKVG